MIFVIVGTHGQPFNRLMQALEALPAAPHEKRVVQYGVSTHIPKGWEAHAFMSFDDVTRHMREAEVIITHAGTGCVVQALDAGKCPIVVPRFKRFGEHVDDHQLDLVHRMAADGYIIPCLPEDTLVDCLEQARARTTVKKIHTSLALIQRVCALIDESATKNL